MFVILVRESYSLFRAVKSKVLIAKNASFFDSGFPSTNT